MSSGQPEPLAGGVEVVPDDLDVADRGAARRPLRRRRLRRLSGIAGLGGGRDFGRAGRLGLRDLRPASWVRFVGAAHASTLPGVSHNRCVLTAALQS